MLRPLSAESLAHEGFAGFLTTGQLQRSGSLEVPDEPGVYVVLAGGEAPHGFRRRSSAPVWRGMDPSLPVEQLAARWVEGASLLFVGCAPGPGVRNRLRQRIKRLLRFGHGSVVAHWAGRELWQLEESSRLVVAWRTSRDPGDASMVASGLISRFVLQHQARPFANSRTEAGDSDDVEAGEPS